MDEVVKKMAAGLVPQIYEDLAQPAVKEIGSVAKRSVRALLAPVRGMLWGYEQIEQILIEGVEERLKNRPEKNRQHPDPEIFIPAAQALTYKAQNKILREMFLNLIANAMDSEKDKNIHPAFTEVIKQIDSLDAALFQYIYRNMGKGFIPIISPCIIIKDNDLSAIDTMPTWFIGVASINDYDMFSISTSLVRLQRLGLVELMHGKSLHNCTEAYINLIKNDAICNLFKIYQEANPELNLTLIRYDSYMYISEFGKQFAVACI